LDFFALDAALARRHAAEAQLVAFAGRLGIGQGSLRAPLARQLPSIFHVLSNANFGEIQERAYAFRDRHA
jgi:hypothetical protein